MKPVQANVVLTDIEGTTTSISFVKEILFPYAKQHTLSYLEQRWNAPSTQTIVIELLDLPHYKNFAAGAKQEATAEHISDFVNYLTDKDIKAAPLKTLQGLVWAQGYASGSIKGHVYADVPAAFRRWQNAGIRIAIYSSGSVKAQQLLFGETEVGDLLPYICAHFDTAVGHKQQTQSYKNIAAKLAVNCADILFLTDIVNEAEAARAAGMQTAILDRPGNSPLTDDQKAAFNVVKDFDTLELATK